MASLRKRFSNWALGTGDVQNKRSGSLDVNRGSIDSGYHSVTRKQWTQPSSLRVTKDSPNSPPRTLHKALSTTFGFLAETVRQGAAALYQQPGDEDDLTYEKSTPDKAKETPKKHRRRSSLFSSGRSRKGLFSSRSREADLRASSPFEEPSTPTRVSEEKAPVIDVNIPRSAISHENLQQTKTTKPGSGVTVLWPSPARVATGLEDPYIDRDDLSIRVHHFLNSAMSTTSSPKNKLTGGDDKGYLAESESNAEQSESEALFSPGLYPIESNQSQVTIRPAGENLQRDAKSEIVDKPSSPKQPTIPIRGSSTKCTEQSPQRHPPLASLRVKPDRSRLPSEMYEADVEVSESSPDRVPSMGSRAAWENARADRDRRYMAVLDSNNTPELESPSRCPLPETPPKTTEYDDEVDSSSEFEAIGTQLPRTCSPSGTLCYAVEAVERQSGPDLDTESFHIHSKDPNLVAMLSTCLTTEDSLPPDIAYALDYYDKELLSNSDTETSDILHSQQLDIAQPEDAYEAGLRAAGLTAYVTSRKFSNASREDYGQTPFNPDQFPRVSTPTNHTRSISNLSEVTDDSCAVTTSSPACGVPSPFPSLHVRSDPARLVSADLRALKNEEKIEIPLAGPANSGFRVPSPKTNELKPDYEDINDDTAVETLVAEVISEMARDQAANDNEISSELESEHTSPERPFTAARLPKFGPPSPLAGPPKSRRSLRREKKAAARMPLNETTGNVAEKTVPPKVIQSPQFGIKQFKSPSGTWSPYSGFELEPISYAGSPPPAKADSSPSNRDKRSVYFARDVEIIGHNGNAGRGSRDSSDVDDHVNSEMSARNSENPSETQLAEDQNHSADSLMTKIRIGDQRNPGSDSEKENCDKHGSLRKRKPRWRVPARVTDSYA